MENPFYRVLGDDQAYRPYPEKPSRYRNPFQRDRSRILHTQAFRRLKGKTQVVPLPENDHVRTRLTHTLEVAQLARDMARYLGFTEDLAEALALAHDLGHPPFGHAGERALQACDRHFEHNRQALRILLDIEWHSPLYRGLNLTAATVDGLIKHHFPVHKNVEFESIAKRYKLDLEKIPSPEAQLVPLADEIAYYSHDLEDGLLGAWFGPEVLFSAVPFLKDFWIGDEELPVRLRVKMLVRSFIDCMVRDVLNGGARGGALCFSDELRPKLAGLRSFLFASYYEHPDIFQSVERHTGMLRRLWEYYVRKAFDKVPSNLRRYRSPEKAVTDYVAGMTDAYAIRLYKDIWRREL